LELSEIESGDEMKTLFVITTIAVLLSSSAVVLPQADTVKAIQVLEDEMNTAFNRYDAATLSRLWGDDLSFISPNGTIATKAERLAGLKSVPANIPVSTNESVSVKVYGDIAVAIVVSRWTGTTDGKTTSTLFRATHVWARRSGDWKLVAAHVSQLRN
jgi:ketosteroid isomerase-like protein